MNKTQTIILTVFGVFLVLAVMIFAGFIPTPNRGGGPVGGASGPVVVWGFLSEDSMRPILDSFRLQFSSIQLSYVEKNRKTFDEDLVNALASGTGPDLVLIAQENIFQHRDRLFSTSFESFNRRLYTDNFIQGANLFLTNQGIQAYPIVVDPMVMYYNRTLLENDSIVAAPTTWQEVFGLASRLTKFNSNLQITKSAVALGEFNNITHAKDIIAMLFLQAGNPLILQQSDGRFIPVVHDPFSQKNSAGQALTFFTEFSNPLNTVYSWNKSLPQDREMFARGDLALYFGMASEVLEIQRQNPNLNFDVALMPQAENAEARVTFGDIYGLAVTRQSANPNAAFFVASTFANNIDFAKQFSEEFYLPSARREVLLQPESDYYMSLFNTAALQSRAWLDPDSEKTDSLFSVMLEDILSGREQITDAATELAESLILLLQ